MVQRVSAYSVVKIEAVHYFGIRYCHNYTVCNFVYMYNAISQQIKSTARIRLILEF